MLGICLLKITNLKSAVATLKTTKNLVQNCSDFFVFKYF